MYYPEGGISYPKAVTNAAAFGESYPDFICYNKQSQGIQNIGVLPIKYSTSKAEKIRKFLLGLHYPYSETPPNQFPIEERGAIHDFQCALDAYIEADGKMSIERIIKDATTPEGRKLYKDFRHKAFVTLSGGVTLDEFDIPMHDKSSIGFLRSIGDIFNYKYLLFWEEEPEDYLYGIQPYEVDISYLKKFKKTFKNLIKHLKPPNIDKLEISSKISNSSCFEEMKTQPHFIRANKKQFKLPENQVRKLCKRCIIPALSGYRDTIINSTDDLFRISCIEQSAQQLVDQLEGSVLRNVYLFEKEYFQKCKQHSFFYCRDLKKEGITRPREIIQTMLEVLHEIYPELEEYNSPNFFNKFEILLKNKEIFKPIKGTGLGMCNALVSLMQFTIHRMVLEEAEVDLTDCYHTALNDDMAVMLKSNEDLIEYYSLDVEICTKLGLHLNLQKSFYSEGGCYFLETYYLKTMDNFNNKESYDLKMLYNVLRMPNISLAKNLAASINTNEVRRIKFASIYEKYWGYEFFKNESQYPSELGGWFSHTYLDCSLTLFTIDKQGYNPYLNKAYQACKKRILERTWMPSNEDYYLGYLNGLDLDLLNEDQKSILYIGKVCKIFNKLAQLPKNTNKLIKAYRHFTKERIEIFNNSPMLSETDFIELFCKESKKTLLYPRSYGQTIVPRISKFHFVDINSYQQNAKFGLLKYIYPKDKQFSKYEPDNWNWRFLQSESRSYRLLAINLQFLQELYIMEEEIDFLSHDRSFLIDDQKTFDDLQDTYINWQRALHAYYDLNLLPVIPETKYRPEITKENPYRYIDIDFLNFYIESETLNQFGSKGLRILIDIFNIHTIHHFIEFVESYIDEVQEEKIFEPIGDSIKDEILKKTHEIHLDVKQGYEDIFDDTIPSKVTEIKEVLESEKSEPELIINLQSSPEISEEDLGPNIWQFEQKIEESDIEKPIQENVNIREEVIKYITEDINYICGAIYNLSYSSPEQEGPDIIRHQVYMHFKEIYIDAHNFRDALSDEELWELFKSLRPPDDQEPEEIFDEGFDLF